MNHDYFMEKALELAEKSLSNEEFPVGCILEYNGKIISNGNRVHTKVSSVNETEHAEMITLKNYSDKNLNIDPKKLTIYCTLEPCLMCFGSIIINGIGSVVYAYEDVMGGGTSCNLSTLPPLYKDSEIIITPGVLRKKSLKLFKKFFENPENTYWKGSYLERYTLEQD